MSGRRGGELTCEEGLEGDREELGDRTWATNAGATAEALIGTPSSSGCRWEISMLSLPPLLGISADGDRGPKSDSDSSLEVTRIAVSRALTCYQREDHCFVMPRMFETGFVVRVRRKGLPSGFLPDS